MTSSPLELKTAQASGVKTTDDALVVDLVDGRSISVPLAWYPRLLHGTPAERSNWRLIGNGEGIHWPDLDEDISVEGMLAGRASGESQASLRRWLGSRRTPPSKDGG
jgi:hypothetical protein